MKNSAHIPTHLRLTSLTRMSGFAGGVRKLGALAALAMSFAAHADDIAVVTSAKDSGTCLANNHLGLTADEVRAYAVEALTEKGYHVVPSPPVSGQVAHFEVITCQMSEGAIVAYSASVGMYGESKGTSTVSAGKKVAWAWGHALDTSFGPAGNDQESRIRQYIKKAIQDNIQGHF